jgi:hypothetical protein
MLINNKTKDTVAYKVYGRASGPLLMEGQLRAGESIGKPLPKDQEPYSFFTGLPCDSKMTRWAEYPTLRDSSTMDFTDVEVKVRVSVSTPVTATDPSGNETIAVEAGAAD